MQSDQDSLSPNSHTSSEPTVPDYPEGTDQQRWSTAIHESGHAVVAHALQMPVDGVYLAPDLWVKTAPATDDLSNANTWGRGD